MIREIDMECSTAPPALDITREMPIVSKATGVVARLTNNMAADVHSLVFQRHKVANGKARYVYTAKNSVVDFGFFSLSSLASEKVVRLGREECSEDEGCDYAIAVVNRRTGKIDCLPTKLICFENVSVSEFQAILDTSCRRKIDYSLDNSISRESWADKRRALTDDFGSVKKVKMQDAAKRRQIKDETLSVMLSSAFASANMRKEVETMEKSEISLLTKAESSVLPKANMDGKSPREIYLLSNFLSDAEVCPLFINTERTCYLLLLDAMIHCYKLLAKRRFLLQAEWMQLQYPVTVLSKIRELFLPGEFVSENARSKPKLAVNLMAKDRLLAHILCLAILLDYENMTLPITPWAKELGTAEPKITKMAVALGCNVSTATAAEGVRLGTLKIARLTGPPQASKRRFSGRIGAGRGR
uniref:DNA-directed RNA polymerase I subunit RPA49 n=1 Tax=Elaeophora elaphi TaxID=1147741 RepID=A0A0R3RV83_9BILA